MQIYSTRLMFFSQILEQRSYTALYGCFSMVFKLVTSLSPFSIKQLSQLMRHSVSCRAWLSKKAADRAIIQS